MEGVDFEIGDQAFIVGEGDSVVTIRYFYADDTVEVKWFEQVAKNTCTRYPIERLVRSLGRGGRRSRTKQGKLSYYK